MVKKKYEVHVVSHTHWDREWYKTFQEYRIWLVSLVDKLLEIFKTEPGYKYFVFDGQTIVLEDYLEIHPERRREIEKLVRKGKILVGPWYILPDEFLISGEAMIRNLIIGHKIAKEFGKVMKVGYMPDPFGHISQMPQILKGFGINSIIFWRGLGAEGERLGSEFIWQAPDGSEVIAIHQIGGYGNAGGLGFAEGGQGLKFEQGYTGTVKLMSELKKYARTDQLLFNNGGDHMKPLNGLPAMLDYINSKINDGRLIHSTFPVYIDKVVKSGKKFLKHKGELRKAKYANLLPSVLSARMYIKQKNYSAQNLMEKYAEPISVFAYLEGKDYPSELLEKAWKYIIQSHPHDSICGCSIDEVHRDVVQRFEWAMQICNSVIQSNSDDLTDNGGAQHDNGGTAVLNTLPWARKGEIENDNDRFEVEVPACGYRIYSREELNGRKVGIAAAGDMALENEFVKVAINDNGTLKLTDRESGSVYDNLNFFEDTEDAGDEYNYSHAKTSATITTLGHKPVILRKNDKIEITHDFHIPKSIREDRSSRESEKVLCPLKTTVSLSAASRAVKIETEFDNRALDHRLRAGFKPEIRTDHTIAEDHFDVIKRAASINPEDWTTNEQALGATYPQQNFVLITNQKDGLILINRGLPEYEYKEEKGLFLTLMRGVGWLSREDLLTRNGHAGPGLATPEAQCPGPNRYEYALMPFSGNWESKLKDIYDYVVPLKTNRADQPVEKEKSYLSFKSGRLILSAVKKSERNESIIIRVFNPAKKTISETLTLFKNVKKAKLVNLNEEPIRNLAVSGKKIRFRIKSRQILTIEAFIK